MTLHPPFQISSRLLPSVKVGNGTISISYLGRLKNGRSSFAYFIDTPEFEYESKDLSAGTSSIQAAMESLLAFLQDHETLLHFPLKVYEWAESNQDELSMMALELEENKELIEP